MHALEMLAGLGISALMLVTLYAAGRLFLGLASIARRSRQTLEGVRL